MKTGLGLRFLKRTRMKQTRPIVSGLNAAETVGEASGGTSGSGEPAFKTPPSYQTDHQFTRLVSDWGINQQAFLEKTRRCDGPKEKLVWVKCYGKTRNI